MRLLVVTSCTASKTRSAPNALQVVDFRDHERLRRREEELAHLRCQAAEMYEGPQHRYVRTGMRHLRQAGVAADLSVISAGYGLIPEDRPIVPYDVTFSTMGRREARAWAAYLGIPAAVRAAAATYPLVTFLLGDRYLSAVEPPVPAQPGQRLIYFARPGEGRVEGPGVTLVPVHLALCGRFHAGMVALKGAMFAALARAVAKDPAWLDQIWADDTGTAIQDALAAGLGG